MPTPTTDRQRQLFALVLLAIFPLGFGLHPCLDGDSWWHLRVGQHLATEGHFPDPEPFSQHGREGQVSWTAYSWLYELLLYGTFQLGGFEGVWALRQLFGVSTYCGTAWLLTRHAARPWVGIGVLAAIVWAMLPFAPERPWHFSILFTVFTLHAVLRLQEGAPLRRFAWLPLLYALWANIHIQYVMGFLVLGLSFVAGVWRWWRARGLEEGQQARALFLLGLGCAVATLATPFHVRAYVVIWEYASQTQVLGLVNELRPPDFRNWWNWPLPVLVLTASIGVIRRRGSCFDLLLLSAAVLFSLRMQRDLWFGVLAAGLVTVRALGSREKAAAPPTGWQILGGALAAWFVVRVAWAAGLSRGEDFLTCHARTYPVAAVEHIRRHRLPGPLFNQFDWGGYLIWNLPELPVSIDGRTNLYGELLMQRGFDTWAGLRWETDPALLRARIILAPQKDSYGNPFPLVGLLRQQKHRWKVAFEDTTAVVFVPVK